MTPAGALVQTHTIACRPLPAVKLFREKMYLVVKNAVPAFWVSR